MLMQTLMSQIPATPPTKPPVEGEGTPAPVSIPVSEIAPLSTPVSVPTPEQPRSSNGRFTTARPIPVSVPTPIPAPIPETVPTPIPVPLPVPEPVPAPVPIPPVIPAVIPTGKDSYLTKYADKLKVELGDKYSPIYDTMKLEPRIDAMNAAIDGMKPKTPKTPEIPEIVKTEGQVPLDVPAIPKKAPTTMEIQEQIGYADLIKNAGSQMGIAKSFYDKLVKKYK